jgi:hypothetical protein
VRADERPDLVLIDGMFPAALAEASRFDCPTAAVCHTFCFRMLDRWRNTLATSTASPRKQVLVAYRDWMSFGCRATASL